MKTNLLLAFFVAAITGCSTAYKTGQTPDDVYYSAAKPIGEKEDEDLGSDKQKESAYSYDDNYYDDRYLRMKVRSRQTWSELNDWYYYDKYSYTYHYYYGSYSNPYSYWNYFYNPYCCCHNNVSPVNVKLPATAPLIRRHFSLAGYTNYNYNNSNNNTSTIKTPARTNSRFYNNSNNSNSLSDKIKTVFKNDNSGSGSSRTYTPATSNGNSGNNSNGTSGGTKSGDSGGSVTRPVRNK